MQYSFFIRSGKECQHGTLTQCSSEDCVQHKQVVLQNGRWSDHLEKESEMRINSKSVQ